MSASSAAPSTVTDQSVPVQDGSLAAQLNAAADLLLANNWVTKPQLEHIKARVINAKDPVPTSGRTLLAQFLLENRLLPRDQVSDLDALLRNQATLPEFKLSKKIGAGGMGTVFLAVHIATQRQVALKTMNARLADDKDFVERFHREARALEKVRNEHIAEIIACGETQGTCWLAMEYIEGPSLMSLLKEHRVLPEHYALSLTRQIAEGLGHVWSTAGLIHRDIKPENVLVIRHRTGDELFPSTDIAKLIDFGLVKSSNEDDRLTQTGMTIGTPLYMSPEQVRGESLDCRSDIYGVGATLYHLLTGQTPFTGSSPGAIMSAHLTESVPDPGDRVPILSKATRHLVMTAMAKSIEKRYTTFEALIAACNEALASIDHKSGSMPRLLRKPMVLKNPIRRSGEFSADGQDLNATPQPPTRPAQPSTPADGRPAVATGGQHPGAARSTSGPVGRSPVVGSPVVGSPAVGSPVTGAIHVTPPSTPLPQSRGFHPQTERVAPGKSSTEHLQPNRNAPTVVTPTRPLDQRTADKHPTTSFYAPTPSAKPGSGPQTSNRVAVVPNGPRGNHSVATSSSEIPPPSVQTSFVDHPPSPGMGLLPWLVLGFTCLGAGAYLIITYL